MDIILLPVLSRTIQPFEALMVMKDSRRSVAVVVGSPPPCLITSLDVRKAKNQQRKDLQEVGLEPLFVLFDGDFINEGYATLKLPGTAFPTVRQHLLQTFPGLAHRQLHVSSSDLTVFEQILHGAAQGFLGYDRGAAVVMTSHETIAERFSGPPPDCCCLNPDTPHEYPAGWKKAKDPCDNCSYTVEC